MWRKLSNFRLESTMYVVILYNIYFATRHNLKEDKGNK